MNEDLCSQCGLDFQCCIHNHVGLIQEQTMVIYSLCPAISRPESICLCDERVQEYLQELYLEVMTHLPAEVPRQAPGMYYLRSIYQEKFA